MTPRSAGAFRYDFAVFDRAGHVAVLLEAKRRGATDPTWASERHSMVVDKMARPGEAKIILVALDRMYGWRPGAEASALPDWTVDSGELLRPYLDRLRIEPSAIEPRLFEEIVGLWLRDVAEGKINGEALIGDALDVIRAIRDGEVVEQVAA